MSEEGSNWPKNVALWFVNSFLGFPLLGVIGFWLSVFTQWEIPLDYGLVMVEQLAPKGLQTNTILSHPAWWDSNIKRNQKRSYGEISAEFARLDV